MCHEVLGINFRTEYCHDVINCLKFQRCRLQFRNILLLSLNLHIRLTNFLHTNFLQFFILAKCHSLSTLYILPNCVKSVLRVRLNAFHPFSIKKFGIFGWMKFSLTPPIQPFSASSWTLSCSRAHSLCQNFSRVDQLRFFDEHTPYQISFSKILKFFSYKPVKDWTFTLSTAWFLLNILRFLAKIAWSCYKEFNNSSFLNASSGVWRHIRQSFFNFWIV